MTRKYTAFFWKKTLMMALMLLWTLTTQAQKLTPDAFEQQLKQTPTGQLVDVRTPGEYGGGHLPGAKNLDFRSSAFGESLAQLDKGKPVFVYCLSGGRSAEAAQQMRDQGFTQVYELQGGYLKWTTKLKPIEGAKANPSAKAVTPEQLQQALTANAVVLVDFYAPWCAPCQKMLPIMDKFEQAYGSKLTIIKADADASKALMQSQQVDEIPTLLLFKDGKIVQRMIGLQTEAMLKETVEQYLSK